MYLMEIIAWLQAVEYYNGKRVTLKFINLLIKNGAWTYDANYMGTSKPLPIRK